MLWVEWQLSRIYCCFRAYTRVHMFETEGMREGEPSARDISDDAETSIDSPARRRFSDGFSASYLSDTLDKQHVRTVPMVRMTRNFLYGNQLSFDRCNGARACLCAWMPTLGTEHFRSHVSITVWRHSINMMIYWRRIRSIHRRWKFGYDFSCGFIGCLIFINCRY